MVNAFYMRLKFNDFGYLLTLVLPALDGISPLMLYYVTTPVRNRVKPDLKQIIYVTIQSLKQIVAM